MLYKVKGGFQKVVRWIAGSWMTANMATVFGVMFICLTSAGFYIGFTYTEYRWVLLLVPFFLLFRMVSNTLDGMLSREYKTATVAGELWNETLDIIGDMVCYGIILFVPGSPRIYLTVFLILTWAAEFFGVLGKSMPGGIRRHDTIGGGKPDRAVWMGIFALIVYFKPGFFNFMNFYMIGVSVLIALTCILRIRKILLAARGKKYTSHTWIGK